MEYLIAILTLGVGWVLAKLDSKSRGISNKKIQMIAAESFNIGVKYGASQMHKQMRHEQNTEENDKNPMGFQLTMKKD